MKWLDNLNIAYLKHTSNKDLGKHVVCHNHFKAEHIGTNGYLLSSAVPTNETLGK